jgi:type I restriction enzyme, S subunit
VGILSDRLSAVEQARTATAAQLAAAKDLPAAYLRQVFDSPEAQKWKRKKLGDVCELLPAKSIATEGDTEVCAITTACLSETGFQSSGLKYARMRANDAAISKVTPGEVLIARSNTAELVGRVSIYLGEVDDVVASDLTIRIQAGNFIKPTFLTNYLSSLYLQGYWKEKAGGASDSMKKITRSQLLEELIPVPDLRIQQDVSDVISAKMSAVTTLKQSLQAQLDTINQLPAALLRQAFNGEL